MTKDKTVIIVGAGFSGTLLAINLLRQPHIRVILIERDSARLARGTAYGTSRPEHLLNVRASNMSAYPDDPDHFRRWASLHAGEDQSSTRFVERATYGRYLREELAHKAQQAGNGRGWIFVGEVIAAERTGPSGFSVLLGDGTELGCDILVLAQGNLPPSDIPQFRGLDPGLYHPNPWARNWLTGLASTDHVLLLGTGLTAVDALLSLDRAGFQGKVTALSRRGLRPQAHLEAGPHPTLVDRPPVDGAHLVSHVRRRAQDVGWHMAIDELRPHTQDLWRRLDLAGQRRFLRHLRPYWDVHRHRIAPSVAERLRQWEEASRLEFAAGKIGTVTPHRDRAIVEWRVRGQETARHVDAARIVNCTGPQGDIRTCADPLLRHLCESGAIRPDPHHLGLDVDRFGRAVNAEGEPQADLHAVGPLTRGEAWEITAVPDIRRQVWDMARALSHAQWVGGEGL